MSATKSTSKFPLGSTDDHKKIDILEAKIKSATSETDLNQAIQAKREFFDSLDASQRASLRSEECKLDSLILFRRGGPAVHFD